MSRNECNIVSQRKQFLTDAGDQLRMIAPGEIGAADRALEQYVADPSDPLRVVKEHHMTRCMTRAMDYPQLRFS